MEQRKIYPSSRDKMNALKTAGEIGQAEQIYNEVFEPNAKKYAEQVKGLMQLQRYFLDATLQENNAANTASQKTIIGLLLLVIMPGGSIRLAPYHRHQASNLAEAGTGLAHEQATSWGLSICCRIFLTRSCHPFANSSFSPACAWPASIFRKSPITEGAKGTISGW